MKTSKAYYEIIIGDTVRTGLTFKSKSNAKKEMRKLRKERPTLRRMKIVKFKKVKGRLKS